MFILAKTVTYLKNELNAYIQSQYGNNLDDGESWKQNLIEPTEPNPVITLGLIRADYIVSVYQCKSLALLREDPYSEEFDATEINLKTGETLVVQEDFNEFITRNAKWLPIFGTKGNKIEG